jgi:hypothetical protein
MRSTVRRLASLLAIAALSAALSAGTALAAPTDAPNAEVVTLDCGTAGTVDVVVNGNGEWTPGHLLDGNGVLIPLSFGESTFVLRDAEGNVIDEGTEPATAKGRARGPRNRERATCTFTLTFEEDGFTATVTGSVTGFMSGAPTA